MMTPLFIAGLGGSEVIILAIIIILIFGGKKIPELMKGIGQGVKSFKDGINGKSDSPEKKDDNEKKEDSVKKDE